MEKVYLALLQDMIETNRRYLLQLIDAEISKSGNTAFLIDTDDDHLKINDLMVVEIRLNKTSHEDPTKDDPKFGYIKYFSNRLKTYFEDLSTEELLGIYRYLLTANQ